MRKISVLLSCVLFAGYCGAHAQVESPEQTPRARIIEKLEQKTKTVAPLELRGGSDPDMAEPVSEEPIPVADPVEEAKEPVEIIKKEPGTDGPSNDSVLAPFYLSAKAYHEIRSTDEHAQLQLDYDVSTGGSDSEKKSKMENIRLLIGPDYVAVIGGKMTKIYDFKLDRYIELKPAYTTPDQPSDDLIFDNISLFAKVYRKTNTVRTVTQNGLKRRIPISEDREIDAYWLESSMSWAAAPPENPVKFKQTDTSLNAIYDGNTVFSAAFSEDGYVSAALKNALFAFAHHDLPVHPSILLELYKYDSPPTRFEMLSAGPLAPEGSTQLWQLTDRSLNENAEFPLPENALSATERQPVAPLAFVINEAANNRALGGIQSPELIESEFEKALGAEDGLALWIAGNKYADYTGVCDTDPEHILCVALNDFIEANKFSSISEYDPQSAKLSDFVSAVEMAGNKKDRATALNTLQPYLNDPDTPAIILRTAAMARAGMKKAEAAKMGLDKIQPDALLKRALATDPYDPHSYLGLAQVYAANGAFEQSWDLYDALRAAIPTSNAVELKINSVEAGLKKSASGYFIAD